MKMTFLGTGGAFSRNEENYHNNVLLETDDGTKVLIDCGTTALQSLHELGIDPLDLDGVVVTHIHADHVGGLEELGFRGLFLGPRQRFDLYCPNFVLPSRDGEPWYPHADAESCPDLWWNCLMGGMTHIQDEEGRPVKASLETYFAPQVHPSWLDNRNRVDWFDIGGIRCHFVTTEHVPHKPSSGLVLESEQGCKVFFSADTTMKHKVDLEDFDVLFHDCMFMPRYPSTVHTHFEELAELPEEVRRKIHLMHYGDPASAPTDLLGMRLVKRHQTFEL